MAARALPAPTAPPPYLSPGEIARACGISRKRAVTELRHAGLLDRRGRFRVSRSALRERLPDYYESVVLFYCDE